MRTAIACGFLFGAIVLLPQAATAQFSGKKMLTLEIARKLSRPQKRRPRAIIWLESLPSSTTAAGRS